MLAAWATRGGIRILRNSRVSLPPVPIPSSPISLLFPFPALALVMENHKTSSSFSSNSTTLSGGRGRGFEMKDDHSRSRGRGGGSSGGRGGGAGKDKIDSLGRLLTRILRHMASELSLNVRSDGFVKVQDLLKLNLKTYADIPLRSHTVDDIREAVRKDSKQRFSLLEENGELLIRANQGHTITSSLLSLKIYMGFVFEQAIETESLLKPIISADEVPVCVHGTYKKNLESILQCGLKRMERMHVHFSCGLPADREVISGMRRNVNVLIFLDVRKALEEGMKLYVSDNRVILSEGFDGVVPVKAADEPGRGLIGADLRAVWAWIGHVSGGLWDRLVIITSLCNVV
ncbi:hypothetical protein LguiA_019211 [Lonicera macranthoides]